MTQNGVRIATVADAGEILTVQRAAYATEAQLYGDPFLPPLVESLADLTASLATDAGTVLVASDGARLIGAVRLSVDGGTGHIGRLVVAPDRQGAGLGTALLRAAEAAAPSAVTRFELFTGAASVRNIALYVREGYVTYDRRRLSDTVELVYLEKKRS